MYLLICCKKVLVIMKTCVRLTCFCVCLLSTHTTLHWMERWSWKWKHVAFGHGAAGARGTAGARTGTGPGAAKYPS